MVRQRVERKLAAVLVADVAGYSRLMELDEEETHRRLSVLQRELIVLSQTVAVILHRMWVDGTEFNRSKKEIAA